MNYSGCLPLTFWPICGTTTEWLSTNHHIPVRWCIPTRGTSSGVGGGGASAPPKIWFVENPGKIPENADKNGAQRCLISKKAPNVCRNTNEDLFFWKICRQKSHKNLSGKFVEIRAEILRTSKRLPAPTPMGTSNMVHHHTGDQQYGAPSHWGLHACVPHHSFPNRWIGKWKSIPCHHFHQTSLLWTSFYGVMRKILHWLEAKDFRCHCWGCSTANIEYPVLMCFMQLM